jgi:hypothetical protein
MLAMGVGKERDRGSDCTQRCVFAAPCRSLPKGCIPQSFACAAWRDCRTFAPTPVPHSAGAAVARARGQHGCRRCCCCCRGHVHWVVVERTWVKADAMCAETNWQCVANREARTRAPTRTTQQPTSRTTGSETARAREHTTYLCWNPAAWMTASDARRDMRGFDVSCGSPSSASGRLLLPYQ